MSLPKFTDIIALSNTEVVSAISETEKRLFELRFKKATRQTFKSNEITNAKRRLAQLKTLSTTRLQNSDSKDQNSVAS
jgi:large subunit ribosomal protein L29